VLFVTNGFGGNAVSLNYRYCLGIALQLPVTVSEHCNRLDSLCSYCFHGREKMHSLLS
jgi:hypothetical protein